jgi:hypothetical protein
VHGQPGLYDSWLISEKKAFCPSETFHEILIVGRQIGRPILKAHVLPLQPVDLLLIGIPA